MSDGPTIALMVFGIPLLVPVVVIAIVFFKEITNFFKKPFNNYKRNKQMSCYHLWRRMDADYSGGEALYRYRCTKCKCDKRLLKSQSKEFEEDFMQDW